MHHISYLEVVEQGMQDVLRPDSLGNVTERVHRRTSDSLLVRLEHLQQLEADAHPLSRAHMLGTSVRDSTDQIDAVFLHLFSCRGSLTRDPGDVYSLAKSQNKMNVDKILMIFSAKWRKARIPVPRKEARLADFSRVL